MEWIPAKEVCKQIMCFCWCVDAPVNVNVKRNTMRLTCGSCVSVCASTLNMETVANEAILIFRRLSMCVNRKASQKTGAENYIHSNR